jgi:dihydrofolate synthase / folylpolyglutamate synthase
MNYRESIKYLLRFTDYERISRAGIVWDTKRIERLLEKLGNPQFAARTVHIAGTKGKGSTSAMIASILKEAGYKVGLYTSPHLLSYTERIRVGGQPVSEAEWAGLVEQIRPHVEAVNAEGDLGELTTFELYTAMAFVHFRNIHADWQVMEVGLGGRLDATNVVKPEVCIITSISYDHMEVLGDTLAKIATEKAGIVKPGVPVVTAPQVPEAMEAIEKICRERKAQLIKAGQDFSWQTGKFDEKGQSFHLKGLLTEYDLKIPLLGEHQVENAACAAAAAEILAGAEKKITKSAMVRGLQKVDWPGRLQVLRKKPWLVIDGAHNVYSMQKLGEALRKYFKYDRLILILGFSADKDVPGMLDEAVKITKDIIVAASTSPRSAKPAALVEEFARRGVKARAAESVPGALKLALADAKPNDLICATGSIFLVAEVMEERKIDKCDTL